MQNPGSKINLILCSLALAIMGLLQSFQASAYSVYVGYADNLRASPFFPNPWAGDPSVDLFTGSGTYDAGAVMIRNDGASSISIDGLLVTLRPAIAGGVPFSIWGGSLPFTLLPGKDAIFTQTYSYNFDTSDYPFVPANLADNCSVGPSSTTTICTDNAPVVNITVDSILASFTDTAHVLDTGGFDAVCCLPDGNESLQWRLIGTTGIENPGGGTVPEPAPLFLLGAGLMGWAVSRSRRNRNA